MFLDIYMRVQEKVNLPDGCSYFTRLIARSNCSIFLRRVTAALTLSLVYSIRFDEKNALLSVQADSPSIYKQSRFVI